MELKKELLEFLEANNLFGLEDRENAEGVVDSYLKVYKKQLTLTDVSFSIFDKVYMDSPFGRYTGVVKGVEESKVIIESHSPNGKGMMLADYDLTNNDWQKY